MLTKEERFPLRNYPTFFQEARRVRTPLYMIFWVPSEKTQGAVIVKKNVFANASKRNAVKRRWRAILHNTQASWQRKSIVIVPYGKSTQLLFSDLQADFEHTINRLR